MRTVCVGVSKQRVWRAEGSCTFRGTHNYSKSGRSRERETHRDETTAVDTSAGLDVFHALTTAQQTCGEERSVLLEWCTDQTGYNKCRFSINEGTPASFLIREAALMR